MSAAKAGYTAPSTMERAYYIANCIERVMMGVRREIEMGNPQSQRRSAEWIADVICTAESAEEAHARLIDLVDLIEGDRPLTTEPDDTSEAV